MTRAAIFDDDLGGPPFMSDRLHHPTERLMMMSAMSLTARTATFDDDVGGASLHERAVGPPDDDVGGIRFYGRLNKK